MENNEESNWSKATEGILSEEERKNLMQEAKDKLAEELKSTNKDLEVEENLKKEKVAA